MKITSSRISQFIFLIVFFILFITTEYRGKDEISIAINSFFRADPLVVLSFIFFRKTLIALLLPGILMFLFSIFLGRFFCGWICPLGTMLTVIKVCLKSALYSDYFRAGFYGIFMPTIIPRLGYCEYNCNLCGKAIRLLAKI